MYKLLVIIVVIKLYAVIAFLNLAACLAYIFNLTLLYPNYPKLINGRNVTSNKARFLKGIKD